MRNALESLLEIYSNAGDCLRRGIELFFRDFKCEKLLEKIHDWPVAHLAAYARLSRISDVGFLATLMSELDSQSPQRRQRGVRAVHLYGMDPGVEVLVINKLDDPVDEVRIEAIHAMADASDREQAISLLSPLEIDSNPEINQAAERSLMKLRGER
jgi:HEAT repeat protein